MVVLAVHLQESEWMWLAAADYLVHEHHTHHKPLSRLLPLALPLRRASKHPCVVW